LIDYSHAAYQMPDAGFRRWPILMPLIAADAKALQRCRLFCHFH
jgi:hypothetical protein